MLIFTQPYYTDAGISVTLTASDNAPPSSQLVNALTITQSDNSLPYSATR